MRHPIYTVSNHTLKKDVKTNKNLKSSRFTMSSYRLQEYLEHQSERILQSFAEGHLTLEKNQYKLFAKYIEAFGGWRADEHFNHLQELADFDVREYVKDSKISLWNKMFPKKSHGIVAKTPRQMKKEMKRYVKACRKGDEFKVYDIREGAEMYVKSFIKGEFALPREYEESFKDYIHVVLYPVYEGANSDIAIKKIKAHDYVVAETTEKSSWFASFKMPSFKMPKVAMPKISMPSFKMPKVSMPKISMPSFKMPKVSMPKISMPSFKMPKVSMPKISMPSFSLSEQTKRIAARTVKVAGLAGLLTVGTIWGANQCSGDDNDSLAQNNTELTETPQDSVAEKDTTTYHFEPVSNLSKTETKVTTENAKIKELQDNKREARNKHHRFILKKRIGSKKTMALIAKINYQRGENGVFTLPDSISTEDFAFAMVMYRAYGVESSLQKAYKAQTKLTAEENAQIIKDIIEAGDTGLGVKAKAEQIHKGPLEEGYSLYNQLSQKDQHQHNVNLAQYRLAKQLLAKSSVH